MKKYIFLFLLIIADILIFFLMRNIEIIWLLVVFLGFLWFTLVIIFKYTCDYLNSRKIKTWIIRFITITTAFIEIVVLFCFSIYFIQDITLFRPNSSPDSYEYILSRSEFIEVTVENGGKNYYGIMKKNNEDEPSPLIILFAGNGQNAAQAMFEINYMGLWTYFLDYNLLIMDYPGYGINGGMPSADNICNEALLIYDYVFDLPYVDENNIIVGGYSIGTGPATYLAAHRDVSGLFLLAPYASGYDLYNSILPIFHGPLRFLVKHKFPSYEYAASITASVLIVASTSDKVVPYASSERLKTCFPGEPTFVTLFGVTHNEILYNNITLNSIKDFLESIQ